MNNIGRAAGPIGVLREMTKSSGGFGTRWMTDLINNIVKEGSILDDWRRKSTMVLLYNGNSDPLVCCLCRTIKLLEQQMKVLQGSHRSRKSQREKIILQVQGKVSEF